MSVGWRREEGVVRGKKIWAFAARNFQNAKTASFDSRGTKCAPTIGF
jgi:hypothetical protein